MKKTQKNTLLYALFLTWGCYGGIDPSRINTIISTERPTSSVVSVAFGKVNSKELELSYLPDTMLNPASVTKLVTAAAGLTKLGTTYTCSTRVFLSSALNDSGTTKGDVFIVGGGDPTFTAERLWLFCRQLRLAGLSAINGNLIFDDSFFDQTISGPGFGEDQSSRAYESPIGALSSNFNTISVVVRPLQKSGVPLIAELFPPIPGVTINNRTTTVQSAKATPLAIETGSGTSADYINLTGSKNVDDSPVFVFRRASNPTLNFAATFSAFCKENGILIRGNTRKGIMPDSLYTQKHFFVFLSEPLTHTVNAMFKYSSNFAAEMLFKTLGHRAGGAGSFENGSLALSSFWKSANLAGTPSLKNGSGMGDVNRISTRQIVSLLQYSYNQPAWFPEFCGALSIAGIDGTLKSRFKKTIFAGQLRGKTGTLNYYGVSTLAGYVFIGTTPWAFAIFVNGSKAPAFKSWDFQEKILDAVINSTVSQEH